MPLWLSILLAVFTPINSAVSFIAGRFDAHRKGRGDDWDRLREDADHWREDAEVLRRRLDLAEANIKGLRSDITANDAHCQKEIAARDGQIALMAIQITQLGGKVTP